MCRARVCIWTAVGLGLAAVAVVVVRHDHDIWRGLELRVGPVPGGRTTPEQLRIAMTDDTGFTPIPQPESIKRPDGSRDLGQSFDRYIASLPIRPTSGRGTIALVPLGDPEGDLEVLLEDLREFCSLWFCCPAEVLPGLPLPDHHRRQRGGPGGKAYQYETGYLLYEVLEPALPRDALCCLGITMADVYPDERWNFVFGQASFRKRVGVYSFARLLPEFRGRERDEDGDRKVLLRGCKTLAHESGHMFGLLHCIHYKCNMNYSNNLGGHDSKPLALCPDCLQKLCWNIEFDVLERYAALRDFYAQHGLDEEAEWVNDQTARIRGAPRPDAA